MRRGWRLSAVVILLVLSTAMLYATFGVGTAYVNNDGGTAVTSGSFNVSAGDLIVVVGHSDENANSPAWAVSDNQAPDLTYTEIARRSDTDGLDGAVIAWYHVVVSPITGLTITLTLTNGAPTDVDSPAIKVYTAASTDFDAADVLGAQTEGDWTTDGQQTGNITPETSGVGVVVCSDWNQSGVPTSADTTFTGFDTSGDISGGSGFVALSAGVAANADMNSGSTPSGNYIWFEIRAGSGGAATPARLTLIGVGP